MTDTPATAAPPQIVPTIGMPTATFQHIFLAAKHGLAHLEGEAFTLAAAALIECEKALAPKAPAPAPEVIAEAPPIVPVPPLAEG